VLSIESIVSKLHCSWKKPSERLSGEIILNSATISTGYKYLDSIKNELIIHPCTMILELVMSSDPWVPEHIRPSKQLKIITDYISLNISSNHYNALQLIWNEYKYLFECNKNTTENPCQSMFYSLSIEIESF